MQDNIGKRIEKVRLDKALTQKEFCDKTGIKYSSLCAIEKGTYIPASKTVIKISEKFNINLNWLLMGRGEMYLSPQTNYQPAEDQSASGASKIKDQEEEAEWNEIIDALKKDKDLREIILKYIRGLRDMSEAVNLLKSKKP